MSTEPQNAQSEQSLANLVREQTELLREVLLKQPDIHNFCKLGPQKFKGTENAKESDNWLSETEALLEIAGIPKADWVKTVKLQLINPAASWQRTEEVRFTTPIAWADFTISFNEKYVSDVSRRHLKNQYLNLEQGDKTVDEYDNEHNVLGRFAPQYVEKNMPISSCMDFVSPFDLL